MDGAADSIGNGGSGTAGSAGGGTPSSSAGGGNAPSPSDGGTPDTGEGGEGSTAEGGAGAATGGSAGSAAGSTPGGSGGGGASAGGTSGTAGTSGGGPLDGVDLFDDFEDKNLTIEPGFAGDRSGVWYLFDDGAAGTITPTPLVTTAHTDAPEALGAQGLHMTATGFKSLGTGLGADFRAGKKVYDASAFTGLRFWAKVGAGKNTKHRVQISDVTTDEKGGKCKATPAELLCGNHWGVNLTLTTAWKQHQVLFSTLRQIDGWGNTADAIDLTQVYGLQITAGANLEVDLWVDQFELF